jgi:hypothetical protein
MIATEGKSVMHSTWRHLTRRTLTLGAALAAALIAFAPWSASADTAGQSTTGKPATVRVAHLSPDMPGVDVYVTSFTGTTSVFLKDATYGDIGKYQRVPAGSYTFSLRKHGDPRSAPPLQTWNLTAKPGYAYTAAEVGTGEHHRGVILHDNLTPPDAGHANVRFIQASSRAASANVTLTGGRSLARNASFGTSTQYASVPAGKWSLHASGNGHTTSATVRVAAGSVDSVILLDGKSGSIRLTSSVDAAGARHMPQGSVDAGGGGTAPGATAQHEHSGLPATRIAAGIAITALACGGLVLLYRRRSHERP